MARKSSSTNGSERRRPGIARPGRQPLRQNSHRRHQRGDADQLSLVCHVGHRQPRPARCARWPEASAAPHPVRDVRHGSAARFAVSQERAHRGRCAGQIPPARRPERIRRDGAHGAGFLDALFAGGWPGQLWQCRRRPTGGHALHRGAPQQAGHGNADRPGQRARSILPTTTTAPKKNPLCCPPPCPT